MQITLNREIQVPSEGTSQKWHLRPIQKSLLRYHYNIISGTYVHKCHIDQILFVGRDLCNEKVYNSHIYSRLPESDANKNCPKIRRSSRPRVRLKNSDLTCNS